MSQQLNLVNPALLPPKPFFQFRSATLALAVMAAVLIAFSVLILSRIALYEQSAALIAQRLVTETAAVEALEQKSGKREVSPRLVDEQSAVLAERQRLEILAAQINQLGGRQSLRSRADVLFALAERPINGLWLTSIEVQGERIAIDGMTLDAARVPTWLAELQRSPVFAGQRFGGIELLAAPPGTSDPVAAQTPLAFHLTALPAERKAP